MNDLRYLVTWDFLPVPLEMAKTALKLLEASEAWLEKEMQPGGCVVEVWATTDGTGGVAIAENKSNDELFLKIQEMPFSPFMKINVTPLTDIKLSIETGKKQYKQMAGL